MASPITRFLVELPALVFAAGIAAVPASAGPKWRPPVALGDANSSLRGSQVAFDAQGNAMVVWVTNQASHAVVRASVRPAGSTVWQPPVDLSVGDHDSFAPQIEI